MREVSGETATTAGRRLTASNAIPTTSRRVRRPLDAGAAAAAAGADWRRPTITGTLVRGMRGAERRRVGDDGDMPENPSQRSVKIGADERTGWSSERPRRDGAPPRPVDISEKCRVLRPTDRMRYSPGSIVIIAGPVAVGLDRFADRVVEERGVVLSLAKVRALLQGRVAEDELEYKAAELLDAAVQKRLAARQSIVIPVEGLQEENRERFVRPAHAVRRPRHLILVDGSPDQVSDEERPLLDEMRRALDSGELGREGFQTAMRLSGQTRDELKRIVFARPPADD
jgi:hypothetical protein